MSRGLGGLHTVVFTGSVVKHPGFGAWRFVTYVEDLGNARSSTCREHLTGNNVPVIQLMTRS